MQESRTEPSRGGAVPEGDGAPQTELHELLAREQQGAAELRAQVTRLSAELAEARWSLDRRRGSRVMQVRRTVWHARRQPARRRTLLRDVLRALRSPESAQPPVRPTRATSPQLTATTASATPAIERLPLDPPVPSRPELTVAVVLDPFSELGFAWEWTQVAVGPDDFEQVLTEQPPDLLFVESAWRGNGGRWNYAMTATDAPKEPLRALVEWCRARGVPTVFWNKEDPPNFDRFIATAALFDHVLTVDEDCVARYKDALGHERVGVLPFAAQPRIHNPVRGREPRAHDVAFAGTYFADKHEVRREQMDLLLPPAAEQGLHIYSRMQGDQAKYQFPEHLAGHVVGSLPYEDMLSAYKAYKVFLNVNSVTESPSMCARRVFELSACATPVLSGWSRGIEEMFGDLVPIVHDQAQARERLVGLLNSPELRDRLAHRAFRHVMTHHTYRQRVDAVLGHVGLPVVERRRSVSVVVPTMRPQQLATIYDNIARQVHDDLELVLVLHGLDLDPAAVEQQARKAGIERVQAVAADSSLTLGACMNLGLERSSGDYVAKMDDDNFYGAHFLSDLLLAFDYTSAGVVGKWAHYVHLESQNATLLRFARWENRYCGKVQGGTMLMQGDLARSMRFLDVPRAVDTTFLDRCTQDGVGVYSADRFNFVSKRKRPAAHTWGISDNELLSRSAVLQFYGASEAHAAV